MPGSRRTLLLMCSSCLMLGGLLGFTIGTTSKSVNPSSESADLTTSIELLTAHSQQQANALQIAEASMARLAQEMDAQDRDHELEVQELELYRRIESGGSQQGLKLESVELQMVDDWPALKITIFQVGGRDRAKGRAGATLIGTDLAGAEAGRLVLVDVESSSAMAFEFQFFTRLSIPLPLTVPAPGDQTSFETWFEGLDLVEIALIPEGLGKTPMRITVPANQITVGFLE